MSEKLFKEIVTKVLREDAREEAFRILTIGSENRGPWEKELKDVVDYYTKGLENGGHSDFNIVCMAMDFAKYKLVNANIMEQKPTDSFGDVAWMFDKKEDDTEEN